VTVVSTAAVVCSTGAYVASTKLPSKNLADDEHWLMSVTPKKLFKSDITPSCDRSSDEMGNGVDVSCTGDRSLVPSVDGTPCIVVDEQ
jgi:hypothetical protein